MSNTGRTKVNHPSNSTIHSVISWDLGNSKVPDEAIIG
jgi:hypothetical protein